MSAPAQPPAVVKKPAAARGDSERKHASSPRPGRDRESILVVEDEPLNRQVITRYLGVSGYRVWSAERGDEGLEVALRENPDLVVLDYQLPGLNGLELVARLREQRRSMAVVMMSAYDLRPAERKLKTFGNHVRGPGRSFLRLGPKHRGANGKPPP